MDSSVHVPPELLGHIFSFGLPEIPEFLQITHQYDNDYSTILRRNRKNRVQHWGSLRLVCTQWNAIVMKNPHLWTTIIIEMPSSPSHESVTQLVARVTAQLARSKASPLEMILAASRSPFPQHLLGILGENLHRAHTLWIICPYWQEILQLAFDGTHPPSRLHHLRVHNAFRPMKRLPRSIQGSGEEFKPTTLQLSRVDFTSPFLSANLSQLIELDLHGSMVSSESLIQVISRATALELLCIPYIEAIDCSPITSPKLRMLTLVSACRELGPGYTITLPQSPSLRHLHLIGSSLLSVTLPGHPHPRIVTVNYLNFRIFGLPIIPYPIDDLRLQNFPAEAPFYQELAHTILERSKSDAALNARRFTISSPHPLSSREKIHGFITACKTILQAAPQAELHIILTAGVNPSHPLRGAAEASTNLLKSLRDDRITFILEWPL